MNVSAIATHGGTPPAAAVAAGHPRLTVDCLNKCWGRARRPSVPRTVPRPPYSRTYKQSGGYKETAGCS